MLSLFRIFFCIMLYSTAAQAYSGPKGLYVLEYPVDMPSVSVTSEQGQALPIADASSDLTVMFFWSQNCFPCLREMKYLEKFYHKASRDNIRVMLISSASEWKDSREERLFLIKYGAPTIPFYLDTDNRLSLSLGIGSTPYTVIADRRGKKVATIQGEADWNSDKLYAQIKKLIKQPELSLPAGQAKSTTQPLPDDSPLSAKHTLPPDSFPAPQPPVYAPTR